jgi:hypothetical protein
MTITAAGILAFASEALGMHDSPYTGTDLDVQIQAACDDLAEMHCLDGEDATGTLTSSSTYLAYPSNALATQQAIKSVVLTDSSGVRQAPLEWLPGGWAEYNRLMECFGSGSRGTPKYRVCDGSKIWLYPAPSEAYTSVIRYYRNHQAVSVGIEFPDSWKLAVYYGTVYFKHLLAGSAEEMAIWEPRYMAKKSFCGISIPRDGAMKGL